MFDIRELQEIANDCRMVSWDTVWKCTDIIALTFGMMANVGLLWLLLKDMKAISASKVLGLNLAVMDIVYLSMTPFSLASSHRPNINQSLDYTVLKFSHVELANNIFDMINMVGCPLLLACMCIERYLAVAKPVLYRNAAKLEYRVGVSAVVWLVTSAFCAAVGRLRRASVILLPISGLVSLLFIVMLACLWGVVRSLRQQSPAYTTSGNSAHIGPQKAQAVRNVLLVIVPSVISYLPVLVMFPMIFYISTNELEVSTGLCSMLELCMLFPRLGVLIGPLFYFSKVRQVFCLCGTGDTVTTKT